MTVLAQKKNYLKPPYDAFSRIVPVGSSCYSIGKKTEYPSWWNLKNLIDEDSPCL